MSEKNERNPYTMAMNAYGAAASSAIDGRSMEAQVLLKAAQKLDVLAQRFRNGESVHFLDVGETLEYNQKIWVLFADDAANPDHPLPKEIKSNILSLSIFIFKRTRDLLAAPSAQNFQILIDINRRIAAGLMKRPDEAAGSQQPKADASRQTIQSEV